MKRLVLDASIVLAWCFEDESTPESEHVLTELGAGTQGVCPGIWSLEVANALLVAERRQRVTQAHAVRFLETLSALDIWVDATGADRVWQSVLPLARAHQLSAYDAAYLELALREGVPLATGDGRLRKAARASGLDTVGP